MKRRVQLCARLTPDVAKPMDVPLAMRNPTLSDRHRLACLMLDSYRDTVDDQGETLADASASIDRTFQGLNGTPLFDGSFVALARRDIVGVTLVTVFHEMPLLAQVYVSPNWRRRGLATVLIKSSMQALLSRGYAKLNLVVTIGNHAAEKLYKRLGFFTVDPPDW